MLLASRRQVSNVLLASLAIIACGLQACENDLQKIKAISAMQSSLPVDTTRGVDVIYSDSAIVKGRLLTPLLIKYSTAKPYDVMPQGVKVISFDKLGKEDGNIVADSAVQLETENITRFYKNVIVTTGDGTTFRTEELIWDQPKKTFFSTKPFEMVRPNGDITQGIDFKSDDKLEHAVWKSGTADLEVPENQTQ